MSKTSILTIGGTFTNASLPRLVADPLIDVGTLLLWDMTNPASYPAQRAPGPDTTVSDLVTHTANGQFGGESVGIAALAYDGKALDWQGAGDHHAVVRGPVAPLDSATLIIGWFTTRNIQDKQWYSGLVGRAIAGGGLSADDTAKNSWVIRVGGDGYSPSALLWNPSNSDNDQRELSFGAVAPGLHQFAIAVEGGKLLAFVDGQQVAERNEGWASFRATPLALGVGNWNAEPSNAPFNGAFSRLLITDTRKGIRKAAQIVAADWTANKGRFG